MCLHGVQIEERVERVERAKGVCGEGNREFGMTEGESHGISVSASHVGLASHAGT